jgi:hypothetical protein
MFLHFLLGELNVFNLRPNVANAAYEKRNENLFKGSQFQFIFTTFALNHLIT